MEERPEENYLNEHPWCFGNLNYGDCEDCDFYVDCYQEAAERYILENKLNDLEVEKS